MKLSWTQMQKYMRCPRAWELSYKENLESKAIEDNINLIRGKLFHRAIEYHWQDKYVGELLYEDTVEIVGETALQDEIWKEVYNLYLYHNEALLASPYRIATAKEVGLGDTDEPLIEVKLEWSTFVAVIDAIVYDTENDHYVVIDWKLRNNLLHPMDMQVDGQLQFYCMLLNELGVKVPLAIMWEFRNKLPKSARINKNGMPSIAAQDTTWNHWWDTLPYPLQDTLDKAEWQQKMTGKLKGADEFSIAHHIPITSTSIALARKNAHSIAHLMYMADCSYEAGIPAPAILSSFGCRFCEFNRLCASPLQYGDDPTQIIEEYYQKKGGK